MALYWTLGIIGGLSFVIFLCKIGLGDFILDLAEAILEIFTDL